MFNVYIRSLESVNLLQLSIRYSVIIDLNVSKTQSTLSKSVMNNRLIEQITRLKLSECLTKLSKKTVSKNLQKPTAVCFNKQQKPVGYCAFYNHSVLESTSSVFREATEQSTTSHTLSSVIINIHCHQSSSSFGLNCCVSRARAAGINAINVVYIKCFNVTNRIRYYLEQHMMDSEILQFQQITVIQQI